MTDDTKPDYVIGYGKPPERTRFAKGQSGNPKGRPKGSKNFTSTLESELKARIVITENGKRKTISKREAIAKQLVNKGVAGDAKAIPVLLNEIRQMENKLTGAELPAELTNQNAQDTMNRALERFMRTRNASKPSEQPPVQNTSQPTDNTESPIH